MRRFLGVLAGTVVLLAAPAGADVLATFEVPDGAGFRLARLNVTTGAEVALPAAVQGPGSELHPALSPDGKRLAFERVDAAAGTDRIVVVDLATGQAADLFDGITAQSEQPSTPVFSPDGQSVITGRPNSGGKATYTQTSLAGFPNGPFPHTVKTPYSGDTESLPARSADWALVSDASAWTRLVSNGNVTTEVVFADLPTSYYSYEGLSPTFSDADGVMVYADNSLVYTPAAASGLSFVSRTNRSVQGALPAIVNAPRSQESEPRFDRSGRYLAFVRRPAGSSQRRLFVWDTQTQVLLNDGGVPDPAPDGGNAGLADTDGAVALSVVPGISNRPVRKLVVAFRALKAGPIGLLVQRVTGTTVLFGKVAPALSPAARVPLGRFAAGRHRRRWDAKVGGRRVRPGRYLVTPARFDAKGRILGLGTPTQVRIR